MKGEIEKVIFNGKEFPVESSEEVNIERRVGLQSELFQICMTLMDGVKINLWGTDQDIELLKTHLFEK